VRRPDHSLAHRNRTGPLQFAKQRVRDGVVSQWLRREVPTVGLDRPVADRIDGVVQAPRLEGLERALGDRPIRVNRVLASVDNIVKRTGVNIVKRTGRDAAG